MSGKFKKGIPKTSYGLMYYKATDNIGDDIQTYTAMKFLPHIFSINNSLSLIDNDCRFCPSINSSI